MSIQEIAAKQEAQKFEHIPSATEIEAKVLQGTVISKDMQEQMEKAAEYSYLVYKKLSELLQLWQHNNLSHADLNFMLTGLRNVVKDVLQALQMVIKAHRELWKVAKERRKNS